MREKELRLALVCYGGVSLAVYMHGVSKEILKLTRASADHQAGVEAGSRASNSDFTDTETVYLDLLREIGRRLDLHVVVDVIAGVLQIVASVAGIDHEVLDGLAGIPGGAGAVRRGGGAAVIAAEKNQHQRQRGGLVVEHAHGEPPLPHGIKDQWGQS